MHWNDNRFSIKVKDPLESSEEQRLLGRYVLCLNDHIPFEFYIEFLMCFLYC